MIPLSKEDVESKFTKLTLGDKYPIDYPFENGASFNAFLDNNNFLIIDLPGLVQNEIDAVSKGPIECGILSTKSAILIMVNFLSSTRKQSILSFDCPFDARLVPRNLLSLPDLKEPNKDRALLQIHLVSSEDKKIQALRAITLSPVTTLELMSAIQDQISTIESGEAAINAWTRKPSSELRKIANMKECGI